MNHFEKDVQSKRNDFNDSVVAFIVSFVFFALIFLVATIVDVANMFS
ncbi:YqzM family protein [Alteribacillus sp. HJP-4]